VCPADPPIELVPPATNGSLGSGRMDLDPDTRQWLQDLDAANPGRPDALSRLHQYLLRAAHAELARRRGRHPLAGPELDDLAHQAADDALVDGVPLDALVVQLGSNRNAIYKSMFDARRKLRAALVANGHLEAATPGGRPEDVHTVRPS
jgi:hypothetical protein